MGAGNQTQNLCEINKCLQLLSHLQPLSEFLTYGVQAKSKASGYLSLSVPVEYQIIPFSWFHILKSLLPILFCSGQNPLQI